MKKLGKMGCLALSMVLSHQVLGVDEFNLPECNTTEFVATPITFFVPADINDVYSESELKLRIERWLDYGNQVLKNSCIPIVRTLDSIEYVSEIDGSWFQDIHTARDLLTYYIGPERVAEFSQSKIKFYGIVFRSSESSFKSQWCGEADIDNNFFVVGADCDDANLEHELGHLLLAGHDIKTITRNSGSLKEYLDSQSQKLPQYAHASKCGGKGTIMSYEREQLPIYSSPAITYKGEPCGKADNANNAQVLRDFAHSIFSATGTSGWGEPKQDDSDG